MGIFSILQQNQAVPPNTPHPPLPKLSFDTYQKPTAPISPPMSYYDRSPLTTTLSGKKMDELRDGSQRAGVAMEIATASAPPLARTQLPSLTSLFGPPSQMRPLHSPLSDRPSPYSAASPVERPQTASTQPERSMSGSSSYFPASSSIPPPPPPPPISQPRSTYDGRYAPESGPYSRSMAAPISPRTRDVEQSRSDMGPDLVSSSRWSSQHDDRRHEYALGSREPTYKPSQAHASNQRRPSDQEMMYRAGASLLGTNPAPSTPVSTPASSDGIPVKDGLGPKIWTGTHFLPRFVRAAEVPGEGMCYFYDDGSHCKTVIDGEVVTPHWGVTKAGKPRKRLAIACVTCREKKIKCDPDYPRCVQCEKFGRICKFKNAPRGGHNSPGNSPGDVEDPARRMIIGGGPVMGMPIKTNDLRRPESQSSASLSPRTQMMRPASPEPPMAKRPRLGYETGNANSYMGGNSSTMARTPESAKSSLSWQQTELPRIHEDVLMRAWQTDPYVNDPQSVMIIIASFMIRIECTALRFLPPKSFTSWVQSNAHRKSPEDQMLIYSILAVGLAISPSVTSTTCTTNNNENNNNSSSSSKNINESSSSTITATATTTTSIGANTTTTPIAGAAVTATTTPMAVPTTIATNCAVPSEQISASDYSQVARYASERARLSIQLVQTRLLLSIYYRSISRPCDSNDMLSAAISAATCLQLNMELESSRDANTTLFPYNLNKAGYEEMRRRTFWSCFVLERVNGLFPNRMSIINMDDIFIRLPIAWADFEALLDSPSPFFDMVGGNALEHSCITPGSKSIVGSGMDTMAHLVQVTTIWGDVMTTIYRLAHRQPDFEFAFPSYHQRTMTKLSTWRFSLEPRCRFSLHNLEQAITEGEMGTFVTMHILYHLSALKLNRHISRRFLHQDGSDERKLFGYLAAAKEHARGILEVVVMLRGFTAQRPDLPLALLASYAVLESTDVLTAEGVVDEIPALLDQISSAREVQSMLANTWAEASLHTRVTFERIMAIRSVMGCSSLPAAPNSINGCRLYFSRTASTQPEALCWKMLDPLESRFPRDMDAVYSSSDGANLQSIHGTSY